MARHRKAYEGERLTAFMRIQLTPSDRAAIEVAALEEGFTSPSSFARLLLLNGLRAHNVGRGARQEKREVMLTQIERLSASGHELNALAKAANEAKRIGRPKAVGTVCGRMVSVLDELPAYTPTRAKNPVLKKLLAELAAIGNNAGQLRSLAQRQQLIEVNASLAGLEASIVKTLDRVLPA